jgi:hypothetical protein
MSVVPGNVAGNNFLRVFSVLFIHPRRILVLGAGDM